MRIKLKSINENKRKIRYLKTEGKKSLYENIDRSQKYRSTEI